MSRVLWVVEMQRSNGQWDATECAAHSREYARARMRSFVLDAPFCKFRVRAYVPRPEKKGGKR